ncbi:hypothetical protein [Ramlibacter sp. Leaf400]|uniref:hypothetical protein n=1 Tax=Ramlibacter sp. Leaf400 TaxID=1736365 RepID=UPI0006F8C5CD|nr:hypothetical protein [Ramlibacter sp. Leaf400]KQT10235.1 hypothetical protein ASG30_10290 [Ramlibacter sp. Leaf400]
MIVVKTELGSRVVQDRSVPLTPRQRSALILVDGKRTVADLHAAMAVAGIDRQELVRLLELGLVRDMAPEATAAELSAARAAESAAQKHRQRTPQERYAQAYPIATKLTAALGLRGFRLNLAVEAATSYEDLAQLAPRIRDAVGADRYSPLESALSDR